MKGYCAAYVDSRKCQNTSNDFPDFLPVIYIIKKNGQYDTDVE